jgi:hypothetical protein
LLKVELDLAIEGFFDDNLVVYFLIFGASLPYVDLAFKRDPCLEEERDKTFLVPLTELICLFITDSVFETLETPNSEGIFLLGGLGSVGLLPLGLSYELLLLYPFINVIFINYNPSCFNFK